MRQPFVCAAAAWLVCGTITAAAAPAAGRVLLWGDTHLHTSYSFDAFLNNNLTADPDTAYRFAKGEPVIHPYHRARVQLGTPLDFLVVSDHAEFLGALRDVYHRGIVQDDAGPIDRILNWYRARAVRQAVDAGEGPPLFRGALPVAQDPRRAAEEYRQQQTGLPDMEQSRREAWAAITEAADAHYRPGRFTTLIGWEWSSVPGGANLHRVVITDAGGEAARGFLPYASTDSPYPEDLWAWLDKTADATGARFLAIPHNSNISKGLMFAEETLAGEPVDADQAATRLRWEKVVEVTQIKGDSETHPLFSPDDEFAGFETYPHYIQQEPTPYDPQPGDYVRPALGTGLALGARLGVNPFRFGLIGSTDAHTGLSTAEENNFWGKMATDSTPETKINTQVAGGSRGWSMSASGLAAVWAEANTREALLDAFERREVYATTGPRIRVRFFGGWEFAAADLDAPDRAALGYRKGVPMGSELTADATRAPTFLVIAEKDPVGANLDRIQIVKGALTPDGSFAERVVDVALAGDRTAGPDGKAPPVGDTVDQTTGRYTNTIGAAALAGVWHDAEFDPARPAFYYARVIEIPTPRHALLDALALGMEAPTEGAAVIQERAYTSPIWIDP